MSIEALIEAAQAVIAESNEQYQAACDDGETTAYCTTLTIPDLEGAIDAIGDDEFAALAVGRAALAYERAKQALSRITLPCASEVIDAAHEATKSARHAYLEAVAAALGEKA